MIVIESPLAGDTVTNFRFLLWCCRAVWLKSGDHAIASHMLGPWFMDDSVPEERQAGINNPWVWSTNKLHLAFTDLGETPGMVKAQERCSDLKIPHSNRLLKEYHPESWQAFERGEWPPHTKGFMIACRSCPYGNKD